MAFTAINVPRMGRVDKGFDLLTRLGLRPEVASAHGLPWELYLVSTADGKSTRATNLSEDQPRPTWRDASTLAFMGTYGLYNLNIGPDGKATGGPKRIHSGAAHGGLTWHGP